MRYRNRLRTVLLSVILCMTLFTGCGQQTDTPTSTLSVCVGSAPATFDPIYAEEIADQTILTHLYENLMRIVPDGNGGTTVTNGMAAHVQKEENVDGTVTYRFQLGNAKWSDGKPVTAHDFAYAWTRLAHPSSHSPYAKLLSMVVGYEEARASGNMDALQVHAKNDYTLVVTLNGNYEWFLSQVCTSPATMPLRQDVILRLKEAGLPATESETATPWWADPTLLVTNGDFLATDYDPDSSLVLTHKETQESPSDSFQELHFHFADTTEEAWSFYQNHTVDAVWPLPESKVKQLASQKNQLAEPELSTYTALFNATEGVFTNPLVRQAMSMIIDRPVVAELAGVTATAAEGLIPPGVPENELGDFRTVGGAVLVNDPIRYADDCENARALLTEAGYTSGSDLGELTYLYVDEGNHGAVANALCQQWYEALDITVTPVGVTNQELWSALRRGDYTLAGAELNAMGNDAECFLMPWISHDPNNVVGYQNSSYDTLMSIIATAPDGVARMGCLHDAELLLLSDCALAPLYSNGTYWQLRETLTGACRDARGWFSFSDVTVKNT